MFQDLNRYVYAMYYSFALVSTIAFGDIIGKNYIEDVLSAIAVDLRHDLDHFIDNCHLSYHRADVHHLPQVKNTIFIAVVLED